MKGGKDQPVPVVGIGASAGGIEALRRFFDAMPADSGSAFVVVMHLDPTKESRIDEVLSSRTDMPVVEIEDGMRVEADHVYVIVPDKTLRVKDGALHLSEPSEKRGHRHPVDELFRSLAADKHEKAVAIVLSGTGTNGTDGLKDVRAEGGMILVQSPETAKFDGMPRSAITSDLADHVLAPEEMPKPLMRFLDHGYVAAPDRVEASATNGATLEKVLEILNARSRTDFRSYKRSTLGRRVHRRLGLRNIDTLDEYIEELRSNPEEVAALVRDLMIGVTGFFRDDGAWKALADQAIAPLVSARENGSALRIWVAGCATGEEAYSVAMAVIIQAETAGKQFDLKIFATDAQEDSLGKARDGIYPQAALANMALDQRRRFFDKLDGSYRVKKELRDTVIFARHNLLRDPPFSRMDMLTCRNLLIYLEAKAQQHVLAVCHFALHEGGYLFLGNAETVGRNEDLFDAVSKKWRIYRRLGPTRHDILDFPLLGARDPDPARETAEQASPLPRQPEEAPSEAARRVLLDAYAPASVLIDGKNRVLYFHGDTGDYLKQPTGAPTKDLLAMAREGLGTKLRGAIREAAAAGKRVTVEARLRQGGSNRSVTATVTPLSTPAKDDRLLVSFEPAPATGDKTAERREARETSDDAKSLQDELDATRAELKNTIEEMETSNEELKASNEEVTSMNEELQSTNEELETSKEELQSFNEELQTVNNQLQDKIRALEDANNDLDNFLAGSEIATLFLDTDLAIKWFTPQTRELFDLQSSDVGRPIGHFARKFADENLLPDAEQALSRLTEIDAEVQSTAGRWYMRHILPYRTRDNRIDGLVVTFAEITELKRSAEAVDEARRYAEAIVETVRQPLLVLDGDLRVQTANDAFYETFQVSEAETEGRLVHELGNGQWDIPDLRRLLSETLSENRAFNDMEIEHDFRDIGRRCMLLNGRRLERNNGSESLVLLAIDDITERIHAAETERRLAAIVASSEDAIISKDLDGVILTWNNGAERLFGYTAKEIVGRPVTTLIPADRQDEEPGILAKLRRGERIDTYETVRQCKDGTVVPVSLSVSPLRNADGEVIGASKIARDISERQQAEQHRDLLIRELNHRVKNVMATVQAVASQTMTTASSLKDAREAFASRLGAMAAAHDVLTRENWSGVDLATVAEQSVAPHAGGHNRFSIEGPHLRLPPGPALSIAMALNELCTNAVKYGALSTADGHVDVRWHLDGEGKDRRLRFRWSESGGPPVEPPTRKGFGSRLVEGALAAELSGEVNVEYGRSGVVCTIDAPMPTGEGGSEPLGNQRQG